MTFDYYTYTDLELPGAPRVLYCFERINGTPYAWADIVTRLLPIHLAVAQRAFDRARKAA